MKCNCAWRSSDACKECAREDNNGTLRDQGSIIMDGGTQHDLLSRDNSVDVQHIEEVTA